MSRAPAAIPIDNRKLLVDRISRSRHISKSARLHDMLVYLCNRVIDDGVHDIREQEVGHKVFGRSPEYDTAIDNIVRVHASTLRKRLDQYFAQDGIDEPIVIEIPKGNYAPVFHDRKLAPPPESAIQAVIQPSETLDGVTDVTRAPSLISKRTPSWMWMALTAIFACSTLSLLIRPIVTSPAATNPNVRAFWSQVFLPGAPTGIVLDDGAIDLYQELSGRRIGLSKYFDRSYLRDLGLKGLDPAAVGALTVRRNTSYADANLIWRLSAAATLAGGRANVYFARDFTFNALKSNSAVLLGNTRSNPWMEPFESRTTLRWRFDSVGGNPQPIDTTGRTSFDDKDGYATVALVPNVGAGSVLMMSATGGAAMSLAGDYLLDEAAMKQLRSHLPAKTKYFEVLFQVKRRSRAPKDAVILAARPIKP